MDGPVDAGGRGDLWRGGAVMSPVLVGLNIAFLEQERRIKALDTADRQYHRPRPHPIRTYEPPARVVARTPTGVCQSCGKAVRLRRVLCHDCRADARARARELWLERGWA